MPRPRSRQPSSDNSPSSEEGMVGIVIAFVVFGAIIFFVMRSCDSFVESSERERIDRSNQQLKETFNKIDRGERLSTAEEKQLNDVLHSPTDGDN